MQTVEVGLRVYGEARKLPLLFHFAKGRSCFFRGNSSVDDVAVWKAKPFLGQKVFDLPRIDVMLQQSQRRQLIEFVVRASPSTTTNRGDD